MKLKKKESKPLFGQATIPTFKSKSGKLFRLSGTTKEKNGWSTVIYWIESKKFETFPHEVIEKYLI